MRIIACRVGQKAVCEDIYNHLYYLQKFVGGRIDTITSPTGFVIICNMDGILLDLPVNTVVDQLTAIFWRWPSTIRGDYLICGVSGDSFTDIPEGELTEALLEILNEERSRQ